MVTNEQRHKIADRLREYKRQLSSKGFDCVDDKDSVTLCGVLCDAFGYSCRMCATPYKCIDGIIDLIEPENFSIYYWREQVKIADDMLWNGCEDEDKARQMRYEAWEKIHELEKQGYHEIDRDALIHLADEMDYAYNVPDVAHDYARRIRKACGAEDV